MVRPAHTAKDGFPDDGAVARIEDLFDLEQLQRLQDSFSAATGLGSIITHPDGTPVTRPSNFCRLCRDVIRQTETGRANCFHSDAVIGGANAAGPVVMECLSGGLRDGGASIVAGGIHIGNWLIGQARIGGEGDERLLEYAREIGADEAIFAEALHEVPTMSEERFAAIAAALYEMAAQLSRSAYLNYRQSHLISDRARATRALAASESRYRESFELSPAGFQSLDADGRFVFVNNAWLDILGYAESDVVGRWFGDFLKPSHRAAFAERFELFKSLGRIHSEFPMECRDGSLRVIGFDGVVALDEHGEFKQTHCVLQNLTEQRRAEALVAEGQATLEKLVIGLTNTLGKVVELRDPYTQGHQERVARIARAIADEMGLATEESSVLEMAALVHDIGKLGVPAEILTKPGRLTALELQMIRQHPQNGHEILKDAGFPWPVAEIALQHHERVDGSGYPNGLAGDQVPLSARIVAVADVVEAMSSHRPYRPALGVEAAMDEIRANPNRYGGEVVAACLAAHSAGRIPL